MQERHETQMLENMIGSISEKLRTPAAQIGAASDRLSKEVDAATSASVATAAAEARRTVLHAEARKLFTVFVAIALVVLATGFAAKLVLAAVPEKLLDAKVVPVVKDSPSSTNWPPAFVPEVAPGEKGVITTNFSLFRDKTIELGNTEYQVTAGHKFESETDTTFSRAWCYTNITRDGLSLKVELGNQAPGLSPVIYPQTQQMLKKTGLSQSDISKLFENCPWLSGNPNVAATGPAKDIFQFNEEVTPQSIDKLIAALAGGANIIEVNSPGGLVGEAARGFAAIKQAGAKTIATGDCVSACSLLFLGGTERSVALNGRIGVHQWSSEEGLTFDFEAQLMSANLLSLIKSAGVSEEFYITGARTPANGMYYLTRAELTAWGVLKAKGRT